MKRLLHPSLMRGHIADWAAILLALALLMVLAVSVVQGMRTLPS